MYPSSKHYLSHQHLNQPSIRVISHFFITDYLYELIHVCPNTFIMKHHFNELYRISDSITNNVLLLPPCLISKPSTSVLPLACSLISHSSSKSICMVPYFGHFSRHLSLLSPEYPPRDFPHCPMTSRDLSSHPQSLPALQHI